MSTQDERAKPVQCWLYFNMRRCLEAPESREEAIVSVPPSRKAERPKQVALDLSQPKLEYEQCMFPCSALFKSFDWQQGYGAHWNWASDKMQLFAAFLAEVIQRFVTYQVPVITLASSIPKEAVCHVFEKVNTGGVVLTAFELLTATYAVGEFRLRDDWNGPGGTDAKGRMMLGIQPELRKPVHRVLKFVENTAFLQAVALHHTYGRNQAVRAPVSCTRETILNLSLDAYLAAREPVLRGFVTSGRFIRELCIYRAEDLPYQTQLVPLSVILSYLGPRWDDLGIKQKLHRWFWCGVLGERYGGATESRFARDVPQVLAWIDGGPEPETITEASFDPTRLLSLRTRNSAAYKGIYALMMKQGGHDWRTGNPITLAVFQDDPTDIHHIFPKKWCDGAKIGAGRMNCIINKTAISARTNRKIGGNAPSRYLPALEREAGIGDAQMDALIATHAIDPDLLRTDDFEAMFRKRATALLELIGSATGKAVDKTPFAPETIVAETETGNEIPDEADEDEVVEAVA